LRLAQVMLLPKVSESLAGRVDRRDDWLASYLAAIVQRDLRELHEPHQADHQGTFVIEAGDGHLVGVEVKASATVRGEDFRHLTTLRDRLGKGRFVRAWCSTQAASASRSASS
jgi:hypothetical protein